MNEQPYSLVRVTTQDNWHAYHKIRREILFENRGEFGKYGPNHLDDRLADNHSVLLFLHGQPIGAMRVDLLPLESRAIMRTIAIREDQQGHGHGRTMLAMAEEYARGYGCTSTVTVSRRDAVPFYQKCGYEIYTWDPTPMSDYGEQMRKVLAAY